jgi:mannose-6-phosphate isomerase
MDENKQLFRLGSNRIHRFYRGGPRIAEFRGQPATDDRTPEDWVGSTTQVFGSQGLGLSRLDGTILLADHYAEGSEAFVGPEHVGRFGADPALLIKLLDAGERLPIHVHPNGEFAKANMQANYGKTEAWIILESVYCSRTPRLFK